MPEFTDSQRAELTDAVYALRDELKEAMADDARTEIVDLDQPIGRLSRMDAMQQQKMAQAEQRRRGLRLGRTIAAIERIQDDEYGACTECGEDIVFRRLQARPESPFCVSCAEALERK